MDHTITPMNTNVDVWATIVLVKFLTITSLSAAIEECVRADLVASIDLQIGSKNRIKYVELRTKSATTTRTACQSWEDFEAQASPYPSIPDKYSP